MRAAHPAGAQRPRLGYAMVMVAACLFAVNGTVSKVILASGVSAERLTEVRVAGAAAGLGLALTAWRPELLRVTRRELVPLALFGIVGVAFVQWFYFVAIHRLAIGIALLIQYLAPLLVALWTRFVLRRAVRRRVWLALGLAVAGLALVVEIWSGGALDGRGIAAAFAATLTFAIYILLAERAVSARHPLAVTWYGFAFATAFWTVAEPWWSFPRGIVDDRVSLLGHLSGTHLPVWSLMAWMVALGTVAPFALVVASLRHISAMRAGVTAMLEPVAATLVAYAWLGEELRAVQLAGGAVVLAAIVLAQTAR